MAVLMRGAPRGGGGGKESHHYRQTDRQGVVAKLDEVKAT